jgi:lipopolysaccharide transport system ATP-binding protein
MNGAILGMTKTEITKKLEEIVDFSGCERYIDTPVKRYSSGMMVRLGFAVAAHLDPEILVVDEVLAVGDAEFQKKAIGKMQEVSKGEGRTVLFVSHNMAAVKSLCRTGIVLENGRMSVNGSVDEALNYYLKSANGDEIDNSLIVDHIKEKEPYISISNIKINGTNLTKITISPNQRGLDVEIYGNTTLPFTGNIKLIFKTIDDQPLAALAESTYKAQLLHFKEGSFLIKKRILLPQFLNAGDCKIDLLLYNKSTHFFFAKNCAFVHMMGNYEGTGMPLNVRYEGFCGLNSIDL